jgi:hypothetical protein
MQDWHIATATLEAFMKLTKVPQQAFYFLCNDSGAI